MKTLKNPVTYTAKESKDSVGLAFVFGGCFYYGK